MLFLTLINRFLEALETVTQGVAIATSHRVLSPEKGSTPRYSIPFFQMVSQSTVIGRQVLDSKFLSGNRCICIYQLSPHSSAARDSEDQGLARESHRGL